MRIGSCLWSWLAWRVPGKVKKDEDLKVRQWQWGWRESDLKRVEKYD